MAEAVAAAAAWVAQTVTAWAAEAGVTALAASQIIYTVTYFAAYAAIVVGVSMGVSALTAPSIPSPEAGKQPFRYSMPDRTRGVGTCRRSGPMMLFEAADNELGIVIALNDGRVHGYGQIWLHDEKVSLIGDLLSTAAGVPAYVSEYGRVKLQARLGKATEDPFLYAVSQFPTVWSTGHRGDGIASLFMHCQNGKLEDFPKQFPNVIPQPSIETIHLAYDWRDPGQDRLDEATWGPSSNPIVNLVHELWFVRGHDWSRRIAPLLASHTAEADYCDEPVLKKDGSYEPRYACGGFYLMSNAPAEVYGKYLESMDGWMAQRGDGAFILLAGRYDAPTVTFTDDHITSISVQRYIADENSVNSLIISFTSPDHDYSTVETDSWDDVDDIAARGLVRTAPCPFPWVQSNSQARRLAKRRMARLAANVRGTMTVNLFGFAGLGQRYLRIQSQKLGVLNDLVIEITDAPEIDIAGMSVTFPFVAADLNIDAWNPATEEGEGPQTTDRITPEPLVAPVVEAAVAFFASGGTGGESVRLRITATGPDRDDLNWFARWRVVGGVSWKQDLYTDIEPGADVVLETGFVPADADIEVEVAYQTGAGTLSPWSDALPDPVSTSTTALATDPPSGLVATPGAGHAVIGWVNPTSANFVGSRVWRGTTTLAAATDVSGLRTAGLGATDTYDDTGVAAGVWKYWVTAENAAGVKTSVGPSTITVT